MKKLIFWLLISNSPGNFESHFEFLELAQTILPSSLTINPQPPPLLWITHRELPSLGTAGSECHLPSAQLLSHSTGSSHTLISHLHHPQHHHHHYYWWKTFFILNQSWFAPADWKWAHGCDGCNGSQTFSLVVLSTGGLCGERRRMIFVYDVLLAYHHLNMIFLIFLKSCC